MKDTVEPPKAISSIKAESKKSIKRLRHFIKLNKELQPMIVKQGLLDAEWQKKYIEFSKYADRVLSKSAQVIKAHAEIEIYLLKNSMPNSKKEDN